MTSGASVTEMIFGEADDRHVEIIGTTATHTDKFAQQSVLRKNLLGFP